MNFNVQIRLGVPYIVAYVRCRKSPRAKNTFYGTRATVDKHARPFIRLDWTYSGWNNIPYYALVGLFFFFKNCIDGARITYLYGDLHFWHFYSSRAVYSGPTVPTSTLLPRTKQYVWKTHNFLCFFLVFSAKVPLNNNNNLCDAPTRGFNNRIINGSSGMIIIVPRFV